ncbi:hypothetical protein EBZ39_11360 [bacterium]|nr:hypothetical protein [bacterium]
MQEQTLLTLIEKTENTLAVFADPATPKTPWDREAVANLTATLNELIARLDATLNTNEGE